MSYVERRSEMLRQKNQPFALIDGQLFARKDRWIKPVGPVSQPYRLDRGQCRELLRNLGGLWVMWTDGFGSHAEGSEWYAVICRKHKALSDISDSKRRSELRRGLKNCEVRQVEVKEIAQHGYETYCAAVSSYGHGAGNLPTAEAFFRRVMTDEPFGDVRHRWAAYHEGKMVAFAQNLIYDKIEVDYTLIKLHPEYLMYYPAYALLYKMNEYYLDEQKFEYVSDGTRSILHETGIQEFLIKKFGFEKAYTGLHVHYRPPLGPLLRMARPFRGVLAKLYPAAHALFELDRMRMRI